MVTILAHHLPPPPHTHSTSPSAGPPLLQQLNYNNRNQQQLVIIIHSHPTTLHLFTNNSLQSVWSFPHPIVSYSYSCSNNSSNSKGTKQRQQHQEREENGIVLVVATQDGSIWNVPVPVTNTNDNNSLNQGGSRGSTKYQASTTTALGKRRTPPLLPPSPEIAIKIEDDDNCEILEAEGEEVELWNDEDGLVVDEDFDALDSHLPRANKRQRTASPPPSTATTTTTTTTIPTSHGTVDPAQRVQLVNNAHLIGSETNVSHIAFVAGDLLIFRHGEELVRWTSRHQFAPHTEIARQLVLKAHRLQAVARISEYQLHKTQHGHAATLFVETRASVIYRISISADTVTIQEMFTVKEPTAALLAIPSKSPSQGQSLLVIGSKGTISWNELQADPDGVPLSSAPKTLALDTDAQAAFVAEARLYVLTGKGRVIRLSLASLGLSDLRDQEIMDLPPLCAISPILSNDETKAVEGLYGFNHQGQLLTFPAEWTKHARTQGVVDARETVGKALSELERLSDQVKQLEIQCQFENQRIATYNRLVFELQQSIMAASGSTRLDASEEDVDMNMEAGLLIETSLSTFSHVVADGYEGTKRFYAQLRIKSRANIDWSRGWSVGINVASKVEFCPHGKPTTTSHQLQHNTSWKKKNRMHYQTFASLRTLTRQTPWTLDIELDREMVSTLPLQVSIGLLFREGGHFHQLKEAGEGAFSAYFVVDSLGLDVVDFVEGVEDLQRRDVPAFIQRRPINLPTVTSNNNIGNRGDKVISDIEDEEEECMQCKVEKGNTSGTDTVIATTGLATAASAFRPIEFEIDTTFIPIRQCLSALLFAEDCNARDGGRRGLKVMDMSIAGDGGGSSSSGNGRGQACFRTCFVVPGECLSSSGRSDYPAVIRPTTQLGMQSYQGLGLGQGHRDNYFNDEAVRGSRRNNNWGSGAVGMTSGGGGGLGVAGGHGRMEDSDDARYVWVDLEIPSSVSDGRSGRQQSRQGEGEGQGQGQRQEEEGVVKAQVLVRGSDLERVFAVRQALERRIRALFD
ncbi:hypothetical protein BKA57DRAFT_451469 [Linnemannia elongata]|nr:hypothetical protein BKA57DRAFT_451469 [Linnemannia elongata]